LEKRGTFIVVGGEPEGWGDWFSVITPVKRG